MTEETGVGYVRDPPVYLHPGDKVGTEAGGALHERRASMNSWEDGKVFQEFLAKWNILLGESSGEAHPILWEAIQLRCEEPALSCSVL